MQPNTRIDYTKNLGCKFQFCDFDGCLILDKRLWLMSPKLIYHSSMTLTHGVLEENKKSAECIEHWDLLIFFPVPHP